MATRSLLLRRDQTLKFSDVYRRSTLLVSVLGVAVTFAAAVLHAQDMTRAQWLEISIGYAQRICGMDEFTSCYDIPATECNRKIREIMLVCAEDLGGRIPDNIGNQIVAAKAGEALGECFGPKYAAWVEDRKHPDADCD